jgi:hypothetical protein
VPEVEIAEVGDERHVLTEAIMDVIRGKSTDASLNALFDCVAILLCATARDRARAEMVIDGMPEDIRNAVDLYWDNVRKHRSSVM